MTQIEIFGLEGDKEKNRIYLASDEVDSGGPRWAIPRVTTCRRFENVPGDGKVPSSSSEICMMPAF